MISFKKGSMPHSYIINIFGIKIRFRNKLACSNNKFVLVDENGIERRKKIKGLNIRFLGANSTVKIYTPCPKFQNCTLVCGDNVNISIGSSKHRITNLYTEVLSENGRLNIGKNLALRGGTFAIKGKDRLSVNIGDECLIASNVKLWTTDFHTVIDPETKQPLNPPNDINIGNHCWICEDATIAKGVSLADNTIVAAKSYVTKSFEKTNIIIGGIPSVLIKENINWSSDSYDVYLKTLI